MVETRPGALGKQGAPGLVFALTKGETRAPQSTIKGEPLGLSVTSPDTKKAPTTNLHHQRV